MLYRISEIRKSLFIDAQVCPPRTCAFLLLLLPAMKIRLIIKKKKKRKRKSQERRFSLLLWIQDE